MRKVIHASDIHFGKTDAAIIQKMVDAFVALKPDLVIISGDITQRARVREFEEAKDLLMQLHAAGIPNVTVPGNHDIKPLYLPLSRLRDPFGLFKNMLSGLILESYVDDEIAVLGVNT